MATTTHLHQPIRITIDLTLSPFSPQSLDTPRWYMEASTNDDANYYVERIIRGIEDVVTKENWENAERTRLEELYQRYPGYANAYMEREDDDSEFHPYLEDDESYHLPPLQQPTAIIPTAYELPTLPSLQFPSARAPSSSSSIPKLYTPEHSLPSRDLPPTPAPLSHLGSKKRAHDDEEPVRRVRKRLRLEDLLNPMSEEEIRSITSRTGTASTCASPPQSPRTQDPPKRAASPEASKSQTASPRTSRTERAASPRRSARQRAKAVLPIP